MDEESCKPTTVLQFIRSHFGQIVAGTVVLLMVSSIMLIVVPYLREKRIAADIERLGGEVTFGYRGPDWIPQVIRERLPYFDRAFSVSLIGVAPPSNLLSEIAMLPSLGVLGLGKTQFTDADLEHFRGMTQLSYLHLCETQVTDAGLEYLVVGQFEFILVFLEYSTE